MAVKNNMIKPADLYQWAIDAIENNELSQEDEGKVLDKLKSIEWIRVRFETESEDDLIRLYHDLVSAIEEERTPIDLMALSRMYYYFCAMQLDASKLRDLLNAGEHVRKRVQETRQ